LRDTREGSFRIVVVQKPQVYLDGAMMLYCKGVAIKRNEYEDEHGHMVKNPNIQDDPDKSYHTHMVGAMAEAAVSLYYGISPDLTYRTDGKGGREKDLVIKDRTVEVKATERPGPARLIVPKGRLRESDVYFLVYVNISGRVCVLRGWAEWQRVRDFNEPEDRKPGALRGKGLYTVHESKLRRVK
jgi:hypothetical protein